MFREEREEVQADILRSLGCSDGIWGGGVDKMIAQGSLLPGSHVLGPSGVSWGGAQGGPTSPWSFPVC